MRTASWRAAHFLGLLLHAARAMPALRHSQLAEGGTVEPPPCDAENSTIHIGCWLPIRGLLSGTDPNPPPAGTALYGRWYATLAIEAALRSWIEGSVLLPPAQKANMNYHVITFDSCPTPHNTDGRCNVGHVAPYALALTQGGSLKGNSIPTVRALVGGGDHTPLVTENAAVRGVPVVGFESELKELSDKLRFPNYMRTNPGRTSTLSAMAKLIGGYMGYTRANGLFCESAEGETTSETFLPLLAAQGVELNFFSFPEEVLSGFPSFSPHDWDPASNVRVPEISARKFARRSAVIAEARIRNAHVWLNYLSIDCASLDVVHEIAMAGLEGRGYLWAGEYMDFHARASLYYKELRMFSLTLSGEESQLLTTKPLDGYIGATQRSLEMLPQQYLLAIEIDVMATMNSTLETWYQDELEPVAKGYMFWEYNNYFLFDAMWAVLLSVNDLLLTHGGPSFTNSDLHRRLLEATILNDPLPVPVLLRPKDKGGKEARM